MNNDIKFLNIKETCIKNDIIHKNIALYAHEQIESVERTNLTLLNKIRVILFTTKLNKRFWVETLLIVVYLYNKTSYINSNFKISFEIKYKIKSKINNIKIWDSLTYNLNYNAKKFDSRAKLNTLIDYDNNQYKLLDLITNKIFWSRDIKVLKEVFLNKVQKISINLLIKKIYDSNLIDIRNSIKFDNITFQKIDKNKMTNIIDNTNANTFVSKISNFSLKHSSNNKSMCKICKNEILNKNNILFSK